MRKTIPDSEYTFQDAYVEAHKLGIPYHKTGLGLRLELSATKSVRCTTPLQAREVLHTQRKVPLSRLLSKAEAEAESLWQDIYDLKKVYPELEDNSTYQDLNASIIYLSDTLKALREEQSS